MFLYIYVFIGGQVDKCTSRRVDKLLVLREYVASSFVIFKQQVCAFSDL